MPVVTPTAAWIALGSNVGRRGAALDRVTAALEERDVTITRSSQRLLTRPVGIPAQGDFLNQVIFASHSANPAPEVWLAMCEEAAAQAGRRPTYRWGPRRADADILLFGEHGAVIVRTDRLVVPHPELERRPFFCALLAALEPSLRHPDGWLFRERSGRFGWSTSP